MGGFLIVGALICVLLTFDQALARFYDTYRADDTKTSFCVAQGGACVADTDPELSFFQNPAALMAGEEPGLVYDGNYDIQPGNTTLEPGQKEAKDVGETGYLAGIGYSGDSWGAAIAIYGRIDKVKTRTTILDDSGVASQPLNVNYQSTTTQGRIPFAFAANNDFSWGFAPTFIYQHETMNIDNAPKSSTTNIDKLPYPGLVAGLNWRVNTNWRLGLMAQTPTVFYLNQHIIANVNATVKDFSEDIGLINPWSVKMGAAFSPTGEKTKKTLFMDLHIIGDTQGGFERTVDVFGSAINDSGLRPKGRNTVVEPHLGWASPWWAGSKWMYYVGSYFENGRWEGINGRFHGSTGISYHLGFMELIVAVDVARDYLDLEFSFR